LKENLFDGLRNKKPFLLGKGNPLKESGMVFGSPIIQRKLGVKRTEDGGHAEKEKKRDEFGQCQ
jgi:hypothetical protein